MLLCPQCDSDLDVEEEDVVEGDVLACAECGSEFEVVGTNPLELTKVEDEEDEDDDEDDDDEDDDEDDEY